MKLKHDDNVMKNGIVKVVNHNNIVYCSFTGEIYDIDLYFAFDSCFFRDDLIIVNSSNNVYIYDVEEKCLITKVLNCTYDVAVNGLFVDNKGNMRDCYGNIIKEIGRHNYVLINTTLCYIE